MKQHKDYRLKAVDGGVTMSWGFEGGFALIVVLFILLVIIGASWL